MGKKAIYQCNKCKNEFRSQEGGGLTFIEYRCVDCDNIKRVKSERGVSPGKYKLPTKEEIGVCEKCGGELKKDLGPICPVCKSRDVEEKQVLERYD